MRSVCTRRHCGEKAAEEGGERPRRRPAGSSPTWEVTGRNFSVGHRIAIAGPFLFSLLSAREQRHDQPPSVIPISFSSLSSPSGAAELTSDASCDPLAPVPHPRSKMATNSIKLLTGNSHPELAKLVADRYACSLWITVLWICIFLLGLFFSFGHWSERGIGLSCIWLTITPKSAGWVLN